MDRKWCFPLHLNGFNVGICAVKTVKQNGFYICLYNYIKSETGIYRLIQITYL